VGVFIAAALLICLGVYMYRRSSPGQSRTPGASRSAGRAGRNSTWSKLGGGQDLWEGRTQMNEITGVGLKHSPSVLKKTPSQRALVSEFAKKSPTDVSLTAGFASYHDLAAELGQPRQPFAKKLDLDSWDASTVSSTKDESFLSLRSVHIEPGAMSPTLSPAKTTPVATTSFVHRWESAEVVHPDQSAMPDYQGADDPFADMHQENRKKSSQNPFFGAQQLRPSIARKSIDKDTTVGQSTVDPVPTISHTQSDSVVSTDSAAGADRALQSLIAALELPQEEVERRLRIASMQPSEISNYSVLTSDSVYE